MRCAWMLDNAKEGIWRIGDHSVDLLLTDPPYNLANYSTGNIRMSWRKDFNNDIGDYDKVPFVPADWRDEFTRVLAPKGNLFVFTSYNLLGEWHKVFDPVFDTFQIMAWHKTNPPPKLRRAGFLNSIELIVCCWNKGHTWHFGKQSEMHNFIESPICMGRERLSHPTQKPLKVLKHIIGLASNPGDLVYDPFAGVASVGEAALSMGRSFIGTEIDPEYYQQGRTRLAKFGEEEVSA